MPMPSTTSAARLSARSTAIVRCAAIVLLLTLLCACSNKPSLTSTPLSADLAQRCPQLPAMPAPFLDPARMVWEQTVIAIYGDCARRHAATTGVK